MSGNQTIKGIELKRAVYDNGQKIVKKKCRKCGHTFETKKFSGFMNCRKCNGVEAVK